MYISCTVLRVSVEVIWLAQRNPPAGGDPLAWRQEEAGVLPGAMGRTPCDEIARATRTLARNVQAGRCTARPSGSLTPASAAARPRTYVLGWWSALWSYNFSMQRRVRCGLVASGRRGGSIPSPRVFYVGQEQLACQDGQPRTDEPNRRSQIEPRT